MMNGQPIQQPQPQPTQQTQTYDGNIQVAVTLNLNTWNVVMNLIAEAPYKTANPLIQELQKQIMTILQRDHIPMEAQAQVQSHVETRQ